MTAQDLKQIEDRLIHVVVTVGHEAHQLEHAFAAVLEEVDAIRVILRREAASEPATPKPGDLAGGEMVREA